jgi:AraC-like DNA-binding protein
VPTAVELLTELRGLISAHARADLQTPIEGLFISRVETTAPDYSLTEPLLVVMAQGGKRLLLGEQVFEYRAGHYLIVTTDLPVTGHFLDASPRVPALGLAITLRANVIASLLLDAPVPRWSRGAAPPPAIATGVASVELLDAAVRLLRLLEHPGDARVLAPLLERELLWRLLTGPDGAVLREIGLADSGLAHISRAITWIRDNYAEPMRIDDLAAIAGMSPSAFHRRFRAITANSPLQFQKRIRLQQARSFLMSATGDVAAVGHLVGYDSPTQFNREYRRLFGAPPGQHAAQLRSSAEPVQDAQHLP